MGTPKLIFFCVSVLVCRSASEDFQITPITTGSGLYYEKIGDVLLSNNNWKFITSVDYRGYLLFYQYLFNQAKKIEEFCQEVKLKECDDRYDSIRSNLNRIEETDESMANFLGITRKSRVRRFWGAIGNFFSNIGRGISGVVKTVFGGGSRQVDLSAYDRQLGDLQNGQKDLHNQLNLQRTMFLLDSERKNFQIEWLKKTQTDIEDKIGTLENTFKSDSEKKDKEIKELKKMYHETEKKLKMQEEIQMKLSNQVNKIETKLLKVDADIKNISDQVASNSKKIEHQSLVTKLNSISIDFSFLMTQFENEQKILFDVIKNANRGDLDPYILTPLNLVQMLQDIQPNLPEDTKFPHYPNIENANKLYNIIKPSVYLYNNKVIFVLQIPLVHAKIYRLHKVTSLPQSLGSNKFAFIQPQQPFLMIDKDYQDFILMSSNEFRDYCKEVSESKYICRQIHQVSMAYNSDECEVVLFKSPKKIPNSCDVRLLHLDKPVFLQLQQQKSWMYAIPDTEILTFSCGNDRSTVHISGAGFIQLKHDCTVRTPNFELVSLVEFSSSVEMNYSAHLNLTSFIDTSYAEEIEEKSAIRKQILLPFDLEELHRISVSLKKPETNLAALYYSLVVVLIVILCALAYLVYKKEMNIEKIRNLLSGIRKRNQSPTVQSDDDGKVKIRLKLSKTDESIRKISIREEASTDPESEYLTVRFKVKKQDNSASTSNNVNNMEKVDNVDRNRVPMPAPRNFEIEDYDLNKLRRLKPNNTNFHL